MQINIVGRHLTLTADIEQYATERAAKLPHYLDRVQQVDVIIDREGSDFACEYHVDVAGHSNFIAKAHDHELTTCIDMAHDKAVRQLHDWKSRLRDDHH